MKTSTTIKNIFFAAILIVIGANTVNAQSNAINVKSLESNSGKTWIGTKEISYTMVNIEWEIASNTHASNFEVEYSFDMVNYVSAGKVKQAVAENEVTKTYRFEHTSNELTNRPIAQYRIKQTDVFGNVTYSQAIKAGLKS